LNPLGVIGDQHFLNVTVVAFEDSRRRSRDNAPHEHVDPYDWLLVEVAQG
jgi:hypothetical protein